MPLTIPPALRDTNRPKHGQVRSDTGHRIGRTGPIYSSSPNV